MEVKKTLAQRNDEIALEPLKGGAVITEKEWRAKALLSYGSFAGARDRLIASGVVAAIKNPDNQWVYCLSEFIPDGVPVSEQNETNESNESKDDVPLLEKHETKTLYHAPVTPKKPARKNPKIDGFFNDFDEWQMSVEDTYGDVDITDDGRGHVTVILNDYGEERQRYSYHEDDDGGLIFK